MMRIVIVILGLFALTAQAQESPQVEIKPFPTFYSCLSTKAIIADLTEKYNESPIALGKGIMRYATTGEFIQGNIVLWKSNDNNDWTLTITPDADASTTCLVMTGTHLSELKLGISL